MQVRAYASLDALPPAYSQLLNRDGSGSVFHRHDWIRAYVEHVVSAGESLQLLGLETSEAQPQALIVGASSRAYHAHSGARVLAFSQPDAAPLAPLVAEGIAALDVYAHIARYAREMLPAYDVLRLQPLNRNSHACRGLVRVLREAGYLTQTFFKFPNCYQDVHGISSARFLQGLASRLRNTLRRKERRLKAFGASRIVLVTHSDELKVVIDDYDRVMAGSWKEGENIMPVEYLHAVMRCAAAAGALRMGLLYVDTEPAAAQFWVISAGVAYLYRTAYQIRFSELSVGTVLTWHVLCHLLDVDRVHQLDLGIGNDTYKKDWVSGERERCGVLAFNPGTFHGLKNAVRHIGGHAAKRVAKGLLHRGRTLLSRA
jgi:CelD/BcsL family acetyltransferase involved in cellulose biosynthesis